MDIRRKDNQIEEFDSDFALNDAEAPPDPPAPDIVCEPAAAEVPMMTPPAKTTEPEDWTQMQGRLPAAAEGCLRRLSTISSDSLWQILLDDLTRVFHLIRNIGLSAALHKQSIGKLDKDIANAGGDSYDWKLSNLFVIYRALGEAAGLVTTDIPHAPKHSARHDFNCRVHLLRALYVSAGEERDSFREEFERVWQGARQHPETFPHRVLDQARGLRQRKGGEEVGIEQLATDAFPTTLYRLGNALRHQWDPPAEHPKGFFMNCSKGFPRRSFVDLCGASLQAAVWEWFRASRLDSLKVATVREEDGVRWLEADTVPPGRPGVRDAAQLVVNERYVIAERTGENTVLFAYKDKIV